MATENGKKRRPEQDAEDLERKFGELADVYAETRSAAAKIAGNETAEDHWEQVAAAIEDEPDR